ncbi:MAG TPA: hypothetical protein VL989_03310 [Candidatus Sulfotelmatobacter sp.]|nr:hypothetical protein [Candidatus Sulfotelmatobacter sp.]
MSPSKNSGGVELPPVSEHDLIPGEDSSDIKVDEKHLSKKEKHHHKSTKKPHEPVLLPVPDAPAPQFIQQKKDDDEDKPQAPIGLSIAQDKDLIDKEWVDKAKAIVNKNRDNPHKQSEELTLLKADYMKKRFNKTIKITE